ncbi:MAG: hypothetical protein GY749_36180 [Desulfobacteraceae bacterium]|nr:hypothetical protein [Lentisphaerota bacterium]MCP4110903.1 hypothetical protein [Desulfobacteraceae bacterium]
MNSEKLTFSKRLSEKRIKRAMDLLGSKVVQKWMGYALFLLGATRSDISSSLDMAPGSVRSLILAVNRKGLPALEDQRSKTSTFLPPSSLQATLALETRENSLRVKSETGEFEIEIPMANIVQKKVFLLTLLQNKLLRKSVVAETLNLSQDRTGKLAGILRSEDVKGIFDRRQGQKQDYLFTPAVKAELIQQFVLDIMTQGKTSGEQLARHLNQRCELVLSPRSILHHLSTLGLTQIKTSLPEKLAELKKKF